MAGHTHGDGQSDMGLISRERGKRFEREVAHWFRSNGIGARRSAQVDGGLVADVVRPGCPSGGDSGVHVECKYARRIGAGRFLEQADRDRLPEDVAVVFMREDRGEALVMLRADDLFRLARRLNRASLANGGADLLG